MSPWPLPPPSPKITSAATPFTCSAPSASASVLPRSWGPLSCLLTSWLPYFGPFPPFPSLSPFLTMSPSFWFSASHPLLLSHSGPPPHGKKCALGGPCRQPAPLLAEGGNGGCLGRRLTFLILSALPGSNPLLSPKPETQGQGGACGVQTKEKKADDAFPMQRQVQADRPGVGGTTGHLGDRVCATHTAGAEEI